MSTTATLDTVPRIDALEAVATATREQIVAHVTSAGGTLDRRSGSLIDGAVRARIIANPADYAGDLIVESESVRLAPKVGMGATFCGWSDREPFHVVKVHTPRKLTVRAATAVIDPNWKADFVPGGFCGTVVNQNSQRWTITPGAEGAREVVIRLHKDGSWYCKAGQRYRVGRAGKFYDYNF